MPLAGILAALFERARPDVTSGHVTLGRVSVGRVRSRRVTPLSGLAAMLAMAIGPSFAQWPPAGLPPASLPPTDPPPAVLPVVNYPTPSSPTQSPTPDGTAAKAPAVTIVENGVRTQYIWYGGAWWYKDAIRPHRRAPDAIVRRLDALADRPGGPHRLPEAAAKRHAALPNGASPPIVAPGSFHSAKAGPRPPEHRPDGHGSPGSRPGGHRPH